MICAHDEAGSSDVMVINPDKIVVKSPIKIFYEEEKLGIENLLTFFSFRRISSRLRELIEHTTTYAIKRFVMEKGYKGVVPDVTMDFEEKTTRLVIKFPEEEIIEKNETINVTGYLFSSTCQRIPEYSIREYFLLPFSDNFRQFFVLLVSYRPEIRETLNNLNKILKYPYFTLPNERGEYYSSEWNSDNLYGLPMILRKIVRRVANILERRYQSDIAKQQGSINRMSYESGVDYRYICPLDTDFIARLLKDLAHLINNSESASIVKDVLEITNRIIKNQPLTRQEIIRVVSFLKKIINAGERGESLEELLEHLTSFLEEMELFETLENICIVRATLRRINRAIDAKNIDRMNPKKIVTTLFRNYFFAGTVAAKSKKNLINLGGGKAIYLSPREWNIIAKDV